MTVRTVYTHELAMETYEVYEARLEQLDATRNAEFYEWLAEQTA